MILDIERMPDGVVCVTLPTSTRHSKIWYEPEPKEGLLALVADPASRAVVVDFSGVDYASSALLAVLFLMYTKAQERGVPLVLCSVGEFARGVMELGRLDELTPICQDRSMALEHARIALDQPQ